MGKVKEEIQREFPASGASAVTLRRPPAVMPLASVTTPPSWNV